MSEVKWKPVPDWPGYRVSSEGSVQCCREQGPGGYLTPDWYTLAPSLTRDGYPQVRLHGDACTQLIRVHTIVLTAFVGPRPEGFQACHRDGNKTNNSVTNLRWDTAQANADDRERHGTTARGEKAGRAKLSREKVAAILEVRARGATYLAIARAFAVSKRTVGKIVNGHSWTAGQVPAAG